MGPETGCLTPWGDRRAPLRAWCQEALHTGVSPKCPIHAAAEAGQLFDSEGLCQLQRAVPGLQKRSRTNSSQPVRAEKHKHKELRVVFTE